MNTYDPAPERGRYDKGIALDGVELVIFDFDGVIADSEVISLETLRESLAGFGMKLRAEEVRKLFLGRSLASILAHLKEHGPDGIAADFARVWQDRLFERFRAELKPMPHVTSVLKVLDGKGISYCIASSGTFERLCVALSALGLSDGFASVFSAEQVNRGKPEPDLFLLAAREVGVRPEACLVVEDSPFGIRAAKTANMRCVGFVGGSHLREIWHEHAELLCREGADAIVASLSALVVEQAPHELPR